MSAPTIVKEIAVDDVSFGGDVPHARACATASSEVPSRYDIRSEWTKIPPKLFMNEPFIHIVNYGRSKKSD